MSNMRQDVIEHLIFVGPTSAGQMAHLLEYDYDAMFALLDQLVGEGLLRAETAPCACFSGQTPCPGCTTYRFVGGPISRALGVS